MFYKSLESLIRRFPAERSSIERLDQLLKETEGTRREFTADHLYQYMAPSSRLTFVGLMETLGELGVLEEFYRVESPVQGGIEDFASLKEVPTKIDDWRTGQDLIVDLSRVKMMYKAKPEKADS